MAVEVEAAGQVDEFLRILRRRIWWILVPLALIGSAGVFFAVVVPKKYVCEAEVMVRNLDEVTGQFGEKVSAIEGQVAPYNIRSPARIGSVLGKLDWKDWDDLITEADEYEYIRELLADLSVELPAMPRDSGRQIVRMTYKDTDADRALEFLAALKESWTTEVLQRHLKQEEKELLETNVVIGQNTADLREIRDEENRIRTEHQIPPPLQTPQGIIEPEPRAYQQFNATEEKILALKGEIANEVDELELLTRERDRLPPEADGGTADSADPITRQIELIDVKIAEYEALIDEGGWGPDHSARRELESKISAARKQRLRLVAERASSGPTGADGARNPERLQLTREIEQRTARLEITRRQLGEAEVRLERLRDETQRLNDAYKRLDELAEKKSELAASNQTLTVKAKNLEIQVNSLESEQGNPFDVLLAPKKPTKPTSPNPWIIGIGSIVLGLGLGLALAVLKEYGKNCFRSSRDLARVMPHPVLGTINTIRTRRERARSFLVRAVLAGGSLAFVAGVGFVTWAWAQDPSALNYRVVDAIDRFRGLLM